MATKHHVLAEKSSGYVVNLISKDLIPVHKAIVCHDSLLAPVEIFVVLFLFCKLVGWQTLGGVIFCIVLIAYQTLLGKVLKSYVLFIYLKSFIEAQVARGVLT